MRTLNYIKNGSEIEKVISPFIKNKIYYKYYPVMFCDCPFCHTKLSMDVYLEKNFARCEECGRSGDKNFFLKQLYFS